MSAGWAGWAASRGVSFRQADAMQCNAMQPRYGFDAAAGSGCGGCRRGKHPHANPQRTSTKLGRTQDTVALQYLDVGLVKNGSRQWLRCPCFDVVQAEAFHPKQCRLARGPTRMQKLYTVAYHSRRSGMTPQGNHWSPIQPLREANHIRNCPS